MQWYKLEDYRLVFKLFDDIHVIKGKCFDREQSSRLELSCLASWQCSTRLFKREGMKAFRREVLSSLRRRYKLLGSFETHAWLCHHWCDYSVCMDVVCSANWMTDLLTDSSPTVLLARSSSSSFLLRLLNVDY